MENIPAWCHGAYDDLRFLFLALNGPKAEEDRAVANRSVEKQSICRDENLVQGLRTEINHIPLRVAERDQGGFDFDFLTFLVPNLRNCL